MERSEGWRLSDGTEINPFRVAVVGCGVIGRRRAEVVRRTVGSQLSVVCDVDPERATALASDSGCAWSRDWEEAVSRSDVDVVIVSTPHDSLATIAAGALRQGKHVLVEKPMARTVADAESILRAAAAQSANRAVGAPDTTTARLVVGVGFNHRHHPAIQRAREMYDEGAIGDLHWARCRYGHGGRPGYEHEWRLDRKVSGGGELIDQGVHVLDLLRWFFGDFAEVVAFTPSYFWQHSSEVVQSPETVEDNAFALYRTAMGQIASLHVSWTQWKNLFSLELAGSEGSLTVEGLGGNYGMERLTYGRRRPQGGAPFEQTFSFPGPDVSWYAEWRELLSAIAEGRPPLADGRAGRGVLRMVEAAYESARAGRAVPM